MASIMFICTGNQIRSPLAEAYFKKLLGESSQDASQWQVYSAGTWTQNGVKADERAIQFGAQVGLDLSQHRSKMVGKELLNAYDVVLVMEKGQKEALSFEFPEAAEKIFMLTEVGGVAFDIQDPLGISDEDYMGILGELVHVLNEKFEAICDLVNNI